MWMSKFNVFQERYYGQIRVLREQNSVHSRFLKGISDRTIIECITQPDFKRFPSGALYERKKKLFAQMVEAVRNANNGENKQPVLLLCSDLQEANALNKTFMESGYSEADCYLFNPIEAEGKE